MPLPLFESVDQNPLKSSLFVDTSLPVFAHSADSIKLLKRSDESPFKNNFYLRKNCLSARRYSSLATYLRAHAKLAFVFISSEKNHVGLTFFLK